MQHIISKLKGSENGWIPVSVLLWARITNELIFAFVMYIKWHILVLMSYLHVLIIILFFLI